MKYKLKMIAGSTAYPLTVNRAQCKESMFQGLSSACSDIAINDPLPDDGINMNGIVDKITNIADALAWQMDLNLCGICSCADIHFYLIDEDGKEHSALWDDGRFIIYDHVTLESVSIDP